MKRYAIHENADVAVLHAPTASTHGGTFAGVAAMQLEGGDYIGYGYPVEGAPDDRPVGRILRGYFQRYMPYASTDGRQYFATEMSAPAPGGSSGTVLAYANDHDRAVAIVTRNHDSWMTVERVEEVEQDGRVSRVEVRRVITYGVAVALHGLTLWINEVLDDLLA